MPVTNGQDIDSEIYLKPGEYLLRFSDVPGYITPAPMTVNITTNRLINVVYEEQTYDLSFDVMPVELLSQVNVRIIDPLGKLEDKGVPSTSVIKLKNGLYICEFSEIENYRTPALQNVNISSAPVTVFANYEDATVYHYVNFTTNVDSVTAKYVDKDDNETTIIIYNHLRHLFEAGKYTIIYDDIPGYITPDPIEINVNKELSVDSSYEKIIVHYRLYVNILGTSNAVWSVNRGDTGNSVGNIELPDGTYTVMFSDVEDYITPPNQIVVLNSDKTIIATYEPVIKSYNLTVHITGNASGAWSIDDGNTWNTPGTINLTEGQYIVKFKDVPNTIPPGTHVVNLWNDAEVTGAYTQLYKISPILQVPPENPGILGTHSNPEDDIQWQIEEA